MSCNSTHEKDYEFMTAFMTKQFVYLRGPAAAATPVPRGSPFRPSDSKRKQYRGVVRYSPCESGRDSR